MHDHHCGDVTPQKRQYVTAIVNSPKALADSLIDQYWNQSLLVKHITNA